MLHGPRFVVFYYIVIGTDHSTNILQDHSVGSWANVLLYQSAIISGPILKNMGQSKGFDGCDLSSNLTQIGFKSSINQPVWPWNLMNDY